MAIRNREAHTPSIGRLAYPDEGHEVGGCHDRSLLTKAMASLIRSTQSRSGERPRFVTFGNERDIEQLLLAVMAANDL